MNKKLLSWLTIIGLVVSLDVHAQTTEIVGIFGGTVVGTGSGTIGTLDASTVAAGTPIFGTFSYDAQLFPVPSPNNASGETYYADGAVTPLVITAIVDGSAFIVAGSVQSELTVDAFSSSQVPNNHLYLEAMNYGSSIQGFSGAIDLNLSNYLGTPFASDIDNPGSVVFADQGAFGVNDIDTLQGLSSNGNNTGSLYFSITHAWAGPVSLQAPEINAASSASGLTLLLGALAISRGRRHKQIRFD